MAKQKVFKDPCGQCLFSKNKIVSNERAKEVIKSCVDGDTYFICHKASIEGEKTMCAKFYERYKDKVKILRMGQYFDVFEFVEQEPW